MVSLQNGNLYIGYTTDLVKRLRDHNAGKSLFSKKFSPWRLVYGEGFADVGDAKDRERKLKQYCRVYSQLKRSISRSIGAAKVRG